MVIGDRFIISLKCMTFCQEYVGLQDRWSFKIGFTEFDYGITKIHTPMLCCIIIKDHPRIKITLDSTKCGLNPQVLLHTVKPVLRDHCQERPPVLKDPIFLAEGPTFQCNWTWRERPPVFRDHICMAHGVVFQDRLHCICQSPCLG